MGVTTSGIISRVLRWPMQVSPVAIVVAVIFSIGVGIFFGFYPARKAARLDPIEALRYE
jgi:putative ABC transport system permease protein